MNFLAALDSRRWKASHLSSDSRLHQAKQFIRFEIQFNDRSFKSSSNWLNPVRILVASEPKGGCPQMSGSLLGQPPWLSAQKRSIENGSWPRTKANGLAQISIWHPDDLLPIQSPITYYLRVQFQSNLRFSFPHYLPYLYTSYLWSRHIQKPDASCYRHNKHWFQGIVVLHLCY